MKDSPASAQQIAVWPARLIRDGEVVFQGVSSPLPMVAIALARALHAPHAVYLSVAGGVDGQPPRLPRSSADPALAAGAAAVFATEDFYDLSARGRVDLAFLGAVQVDARGRTNVSAIGAYERPKVRLPGGGGAAMILPTARRVVLWRARQAHLRRVIGADHAAVSPPPRVDLRRAEEGEVDPAARAEVVEILVGEDRRRAGRQRRVGTRAR